jgi:hypothetical protein
MCIAGALAPGAAAAVDMERPPWLEHATRSVASVRVPARERLPKPEYGTAFVVGYDSSNLYLVTASHVIWPVEAASNAAGTVPAQPETHDADEVELFVDLRALQCHQELPAFARKLRRSPPIELDLAVIVVPVAQLAASSELRSACQDLPARVRSLPRNILEPRHQVIDGGSAWLVGRGGMSGGMDERQVMLGGTQPTTGRIMLPGAGEILKHGYSGSPLFSAGGHLLGMIVKNDPKDAATKFSAILGELTAFGDVSTNLAGDHAYLTFKPLKDAEIELAGWPPARLAIPHPAPRGEDVKVALKVSGRRDVSTTLAVTGDMVCDVNWVSDFDAFASRHRKTTLGIALGLAAVGVAATVTAFKARDSFNASPSSSSYDQVRTYNAVALSTYGAAIGVGAFSGYGFWRSGRVQGIACERVR